MIIYIWFIVNQIVIQCTGAGCAATSVDHFNYIAGIGLLELICEIPGVIKVFRRKLNGDSKPDIGRGRKR